MRRTILAALACLAAGNAEAGSSGPYVNRPPVIISPDLTAPWEVQIRPGHNRPSVTFPTYYRAVTVAPPSQAGVIVGPPGSYPVGAPNPAQPVNPAYLPAIIDYQPGFKAGTIVIDTERRYLYLVLPNGKAKRYGVGVGRPGFEWAGTRHVSRKAEWPDWTPPAEMRKRQPYLPTMMPGGIDNPLGARAIYLGSSLYRIHGTSEPWSIGHAVSSGCIRMRNEDVIDLYDQVKVGTRVVVI